jgi:protein phosphatase
MGGHVGGRRASQEATRAVIETLTESAGGGTPGAERLRAAIQTANGRIWALAEADPSLHGMGTTIVAVLVDGDVAYVGHVGDSRVYRIRGDAITPLTQDHSYLAELAARGIEPDTQVRARYGSVLTRALGAEAAVEVDVSTVPLESGDTFVLCSDGVYRVVSPEEVLQLVRAGGDDLQGICTAIVTRANAGGGPDNCTVVVLRTQDDGSASIADDLTQAIGTIPDDETKARDDTTTTQAAAKAEDGGGSDGGPDGGARGGS